MIASIILEEGKVTELEDRDMTASSCTKGASGTKRVQIIYGDLQLNLTMSEARELQSVIDEEINELMSEEE